MQNESQLGEGGAEIKEFNVTIPRLIVRFGLGSTEAVKRWARFEIKNDELLWTSSMDIRRDADTTNSHISVHKSGQVVSSRYQKGKKIASHSRGSIGGSLGQIAEPYQVVSGHELFEPGYLYYGLVTRRDKEKGKAHSNVFVPCLDNKLVNSRLHFSFDLLPWANSEKVIEYATRQSPPFCTDDRRSHMYIFYWGKVPVVVTMKFTDGDGPLDIQRVCEADKYIHSLKRLYF